MVKLWIGYPLSTLFLQFLECFRFSMKCPTVFSGVSRGNTWAVKKRSSHVYGNHFIVLYRMENGKIYDSSGTGGSYSIK